MKMEDIDCEKFEHRLKSLKDTQDSITGLSKWCLNKRLAHKTIVKCWLKVLKEVKIEQRLTLFYLANDVIQHSKRKNYEFVDSWATALQRASTLVRDDTRIKEKISRIFNIWQQREVYAEDFISDLHGLLSINQAKKPTLLASTTISYTASPVSSPNNTQRSDDNEDEFLLQSLISNIRSCVSLEAETDKGMKGVVKLVIPDIEKVRNNLKDRAHAEEVEREVGVAKTKHEEFITFLNAEIKARKTLLTALDQAERFYRNQRKDVKKVIYAYKNFGDRIKSIQTELSQKLIDLPSPIPSPDINAPSPEPENDDFDLPSDLNFYNSNMTGAFGSFLNDGPLPFDVNEFYRESPPPVEQNSQSIQVIQSQEQASAPLNDFYSSIMPSDSYNPALGYNNDNNTYRQPKPPPLPSVAPQPTMNYAPSPVIIPPPPPPNAQNQQQNSANSSTNNDEYSPWDEPWIHTPVSPPSYDRKGHDDSSIVEYMDESLRDIDPSLNDIDHRQLFGADIETKDVDHRNLISLTGSPSQNNINVVHPTNGNNDFPPPLLDHPPMNFPPHSVMPNFPAQHNRNQRPPLLPTPPNLPPAARYSRNMSLNSDSSKGPDEMESSEVDMELSDEDISTLEGNNMPGDFFNMHGPPRYPHVSHQMNRPPPSLPPSLQDNQDHMNQQQRKPWIHNNMRNQELDEIDLPDSLPMPPLNANFMPQQQNNRNFQRNPGNFRGNRGGGGGKMMRGGMNSNNTNNSPYNMNNKFNNRGRGRGGFRGGNNFRGGGQW